jgi:hypothetical protein
VAKVLVSLDQRLLERLDAEARARKMSRSALISELAAKGLGVPSGPGARPEAQRALKRLQELFRDVRDTDSTQIIREMRDSAR